MASVIVFIFAIVVAWGGAVLTRRLPHYELARRSLPHRTLITVAVSALTAAIALWQIPSWQTGVWLALWSVWFTLIAVVDYETHFIPNALIVPAIVLGVAASFITLRPPWQLSLIGAVMGGVLFFLLYFLGGKVYRGGLGFGDVVLAVFIGAVTGAQVVLYSLITGMVIAGLTLGLLLALKRITLRTYVPYGPFLCIGGWLALLPAVQQFWGVG